MLQRLTGYFKHRNLLRLLIFLLPVQLGIHFWPSWSLVSGIRVDYLAPTVYLTDILLVSIVVPWTISNFHYLRNRWAIFFTAFIVLNLLFTTQIAVSLYKFVKLFEFILFGIYIAKNEDLSFLEDILKPLTYAAFFVGFVGLGQFIFQKTLGGPLYLFGERSFNTQTPGIALVQIGDHLLLRAYSTFSHPNSYAGFMVVVFVLAYLVTRKWRSKIFLLLGIVIGTCVSFSKAALSTLFILPVFRKVAYGKSKIAFIVFWMSLLGSISMILFAGHLFGLSTTSIFLDRVELVRVSQNVLFAYPLFGVGLGNFISMLPKYSYLSESVWKLQPVHNIFVLVLSETGVVGLTYFSVVILKALRAAVKDTNWYVAGALLVILITGFVDHYWITLQQNQLLFAMVLGLSYRKRQ